MAIDPEIKKEVLHLAAQGIPHKTIYDKFPHIQRKSLHWIIAEQNRRVLRKAIRDRGEPPSRPWRLAGNHFAVDAKSFYAIRRA